MWSNFMLGGAAARRKNQSPVEPQARTEDSDDDDEPQQQPPSAHGSSSSHGSSKSETNQEEQQQQQSTFLGRPPLAYMGKIAHKFMEQAGATLQQAGSDSFDTADDDDQQQQNDGWNDDDDDDDEPTEYVDTLELPQPPREETMQPQPSNTPPPAAAAAAVVVEESENAWNDDDDVDLDWSHTSTRKQSSEPPPLSTPTALENPTTTTSATTPLEHSNPVVGALQSPADGTPDSVGLRWAASEEQVANQLDQVLQQIQDQEQQQQQQQQQQQNVRSSIQENHGPDNNPSQINHNNINDDDDGSNQSDDQHHSQAVQSIRQEIQQIELQQQQPPPPIRLVDHLPPPRRSPVEGAAALTNPSVRVVFREDTDAAGSRGGDEDTTVYTEHDEWQYGPVVDHTPPTAHNHHRPALMERSESLAVQYGQRSNHTGCSTSEEDDSSAVDNNNSGDNKNNTNAAMSTEVAAAAGGEPEIVDHLPTPEPSHHGSSSRHRHRRQYRPRESSTSVGVVASLGDSTAGDVVMSRHDNDDKDDDDDYDAHEFGPVVDVIPAAAQEKTRRPMPNGGGEEEEEDDPGMLSLAVVAADIEQDFQNDEAMEETCYGSTVDGWGDDDDDGDFMDETEFMDVEGDDAVVDGNMVNNNGVVDDKNGTSIVITVAEIPSSQIVNKRASFSETLVTGVQDSYNRHVMVDHCPPVVDEKTCGDDNNNNNNDPSIVALALSEDLTRDTGSGQVDEEVYDDENEQEYGLVVDHTPPTPHPVLDRETNSLAVHISAQDMADDDDDDDDDDVSSYNEGSNANNIVQPIGNDDSTDEMGGGSGWNDDYQAEYSRSLSDQPAEASKRQVTLVDHTPSEIDSPSKQPVGGDPSVDVLQSDTDTHEVDDDEDNEHVVYGLVVDQTPPAPLPMARSDSVLVQAGNYEEDLQNELDTVDEVGEAGVVYGPVVDVTPTTPAIDATTEASRSDSVVVQGEDDVDTVDETTVARYGDDDENEGDTDTIEEVTRPEESNNNTNSNQLVDFIPTRSESRYGDASTLVAADPSEVLSEVDDLAPEEQNFGPVVDQTPPSALRSQPSGEATSTVVFVPPSVAADLNEGELHDGWDDDDDDHEDDDDDDNSNNNVLIEESTHPNPQSGNDEPVNNNNGTDDNGNVMVQVNEQVVDFVPLPPDEDLTTHGGDTTRAALSQGSLNDGRSLLPGGDPIEDDFGPVVDQIPQQAQMSSHASTATQLTASECRAMEKEDRQRDDSSSVHNRGDTEVVVDHLPPLPAKRAVDSTATIGRSQASSSQDVEEEEEDTSKFGPVVDQLPTSRASLAPSRGGSTVDALATVSEVDSDIDVDAGGDGWDDDYDVDFDASLGGVSEAGVITSTAPKDRNVRFDASVDGNTTISTSKQVLLNDGSFTSSGHSETMYCDPAGGNYEDDGSFHEAQHQADKSFAEADTPPSTPYRRFQTDPLALSGPDLGISMPMLPTSNMSAGACEHCSQGKTMLCPCIKRLLEYNAENGPVIGTVATFDGDSVKVDFSQLLQDEITRRKLAEKELEALKSSTGKSLDKFNLEKEVAELRRANDGLARVILEHENESARLRQQKTLLDQELSTFRITVTDLEGKGAAAVAKNSALEAEVGVLKSALASASDGDHDVTRRLTVTQGVLAAKTGECQELRTRIAQLEASLQTAQQSNAKQSKETAELHGVLKRSISEFKDKLAGSDKLVKTTEQARKELERKLKALDKEVNNLRASSQQMSDLQIQHEKNLQQQYKLLDKKTTDIHALEKLVSTLQKEKAHIKAELEQQRSLALQSETLANELVAVARERDLLEDSLRECKEALEKLQKIIEEHGMERQILESKREAEYTALQAEVSDVTSQLRTKEKAVEELLGQLGDYSEKNERLHADLQELRSALAASESAVEQSKRSAAENEQTIALRDREIAELETKWKVVSSDFELLKSQNTEATSQISELERELKAAHDQSQILSERNRTLTERYVVLQEERNAAVANSDESNARCREFESKYASALEDFESKIQSLKQEYEEDISKLTASGELLRNEVARLEESAGNHAQALQEVEKAALEEARQHEEKAARLNAECDVLRKEIARLVELEVEHSRSIESLAESDRHQAVEEDNCTKIEELRGVVAHYQELQEHAAENLEALKSAVAENYRTKEAEAAKLKDQCDQLRSEVSRLQATEAEKGRALEVLDATTKDTSQVFEREIASLKAEIAHLQSQADRHKAVEESFDLERDQLGESIRERDILIQEHEELFVQLGLAKQQMDESEERVRAMQAEIESLRASSGDEEAIDAALKELRAKNTDLDDQLQAAIAEKASLYSKVTDLEATASELHEISSRNLELTAQMQAAASECDTLTTRIKQLEASLSEEEGRRTSFESTIDGLQSQTATLEKQLLERQNEIDKLQGQLKETVATAELDLQVTAVEERCTTLKNALAEKEIEIAVLKESFDKTVDSSDAKNKELENLRIALHDKEETHAKLLEDLEERNKSLEGQLESSNERVKLVEAALEAKEQIVTVLKESELQIVELETELKNSGKRVTELEAIVDEKDRLLAEAVTVSPETEKEMAALQKQIGVLKEILQSTRGRLASKEEEMDSLSAQIRALRESRINDATRASTKAMGMVSEEAERLRDTVIGQAIKLKRSDSIRAEALQRIQEERLANAERIRLLNESVERYYGSPTK